MSSSDHVTRRKGFALLEVLVVVGIVSIIGTFGVPLLQQWQFRNDLNVAKSQVLQGLQIARQYAMANKRNSEWSIFIPQGVIFPGTNYAEAITDPDVMAVSHTLTMPPTVRYEGLDQVTYDRQGRPSREGTITLTALNNQQESIAVVIAINQGTVTVTEPSSSSAAAASSEASSYSSPACGFFSLGTDNVISTLLATNIRWNNLAALRQSGGSYVPTYSCYSDTGGSNYSRMFQGGGCNGNGIGSYGNAVAPGGGESRTVSISSGKSVVVKVRNYLTGGLSIDDIYNAKNHTTRFWYLHDGESPGPDGSHTRLSSLRTLLQGAGLLDGSNLVNLGSCEMLLAVEMEPLDVGTVDYTDLVLKMTFE